MRYLPRFVQVSLTAGALAGLIAACGKSSGGATSSTNSSTSNDSTPPGTTPVTAAPYPVCSPLESGSFNANGSYPVPSTSTCSPAGSPASGAADMHCVGVAPQTVNGASCDVMGGGGSGGSSGAGGGSSGSGGSSGADAGPAPTPGPCDENGTDGAYGTTHYGTEGDDDDCKYHVTYSVSPVCENEGTYFVVKANYLTRDGAALTSASTFAELCLNDTHPAPNLDQRPPVGSQQVVEGPPGTYTIGPVQFDAPGKWTVRFHFNEFCCDVADDSPHGHAAFFVNVP